jgi:hypothetical protein
MDQTPYRVPRSFPTARSVPGTRLPWSFLTLQRHPRVSPVMRRAVPSPPRFRSQAFSTSQRLVQTRVPRPYFMPQPVPGFLPSESSPRRNRAPLSGPHAPLQLSTRVPERTISGLITTGFPDSHAFDAVAWFPRRLWLLFQRASPPPDPPGPVTAEPLRSASFTCFEALLLLRIRSLRHEFPRDEGRYSPEFPPLQSNSSRLGTSTPHSPKAASGRQRRSPPPHHPKAQRPQTRHRRPRPRGPRDPRGRVRTPEKKNPNSDLVGSPQPLSRLDRATSRRRPLLP